MTRNTENRVEIGCPILDKEVRERLNYHIGVILQDNQKARILAPDGEDRKNSNSSNKAVNSQEEFISKVELNTYDLLEEDEKVQKKNIFKKIFHL